MKLERPFLRIHNSFRHVRVLQLPGTIGDLLWRAVGVVSAALILTVIYDIDLTLFPHTLSSLSAAAVVVLLLYTLVRRSISGFHSRPTLFPSQIRLWRQRKMESRDSSDATGSSLFWNLMISDLLQAIGCLPSIRWMLDGVNPISSPPLAVSDFLRRWSLRTLYAQRKL